jgi:uncharacterized membrane protein (DUF106 family)
MNDLSTWIFSIIGGLISASVIRLFVQVNKTNDETITLKAEVKQLKESQNHEKVIKIEAEVDQLKDNQNHGFTQLEKLFEEKFKRFEERFVHMDNTIKISAEYFKLLAEEIKKK